MQHSCFIAFRYCRRSIHYLPLVGLLVAHIYRIYRPGVICFINVNVIGREPVVKSNRNKLAGRVRRLACPCPAVVQVSWVQVGCTQSPCCRPFIVRVLAAVRNYRISKTLVIG